MTHRHLDCFIDEGLGTKAKAHYANRRQTLLRQLDALTLIVGPSNPPGHDTIWYMSRNKIYQDPLMLYLTGINQTHTALLLDPHSKTTPEQLFLSKKDPHLEFWEGFQLGVGNKKSNKEIETITGFSESNDIDSLLETTLKCLEKQKNPTLNLFWHQHPKTKKIRQDFHSRFKVTVQRYLAKHLPKKVTFNNIAPLTYDIRSQLDAVDIKNLKEANKKTAQAYTRFLEQLAPCTTENEAAAVLDAELAKESWYQNSFPSIVANGDHATVLHYTKNNAPLDKNRLLLLDFGLRWHGVNSDISRTIPLIKKPNPLQTLVLNIVLDAQKKVEAMARPGVSFNDLNAMVWPWINEQLKQQITDKGGKVTLPYKERPHNIGHLLGHMVHEGDPYRHYRNEPLKINQCITNEPGIYGTFELTINGKHYKETIGIRIEDNLLITKNGCENLSTVIPK